MSVHCCKRAVFCRLRLGFSRIRLGLEPGPLHGEGVSDGEIIWVHLPPLQTRCIPIIVGKITVGVRRRKFTISGQKQGSFAKVRVRVDPELLGKTRVFPCSGIPQSVLEKILCPINAI